MSARAQSAGVGKLSTLPHAAHQRVDDGVFGLDEKQSIDLTDRKILLAADNVYGTGVDVRLNGARATMRIGSRIDLKAFEATAAFLSDKTICVLDLLRYDESTSPPSAQFRLFCE